METQVNVNLQDPGFVAFMQKIDPENQLQARLDDHEGIADQFSGALYKLYSKANADADFKKAIGEDPQVVMQFLGNEVSNFELTEDQLEAVAGGAPTTDTSLGYDVGWCIGAAAKWVSDLF